MSNATLNFIELLHRDSTEIILARKRVAYEVFKLFDVIQALWDLESEWNQSGSVQEDETLQVDPVLSPKLRMNLPNA